MTNAQTNAEAIHELDNLTDRGIAYPRKRVGKKVRVTKSRAKATLGWYIFYKVVTKDRKPPFADWDQGAYKCNYKNGATVEVRRFNRDAKNDCGSGLHVLVTKPPRHEIAAWSSASSTVLLRVFVHPDDVVCVPDRSVIFGVRKIRVRKLTIDKQVAYQGR